MKDLISKRIMDTDIRHNLRKRKRSQVLQTSRICTCRRWRQRLIAFSFDYSQILVFLSCHKLHKIGSLATLISLGKMINTTENHFQGNPVKRQHEFFCHLISKVYKNGEKQPGAPYLQKHSVKWPCPQIGQMKKPLNDEESFLNSPTTPIQISDNLRSQYARVNHTG